MECWRCGTAIPHDGVRPDFCAVCQALLAPDPARSHFGWLDLSPRFSYDLDHLAARHRKRLRRFHPDRYHGQGEVAWRHAVAHATAINDAWRALSDPQKRLEYLLKLHGAALPPATFDPAGQIAMDPIHQIEMAELNTALAELDGVDAHTERTAIGRQVAHQYARELDRIGGEIDAALDGDGLDGAAPIWQAAVSRLRSLRSLLLRLDAEFPFGQGAP